MSLRSLLKWLTPFGLIESHRWRFRMGRLHLPATPDIAAAVDVCRYELWPDFLRAGSPPWTLVDVGANEGAFIDAVAKLVALTRVYAFEPLPTCQGPLEKVVCRIPNSKVVAAAVGSCSGVIEINSTGDSKMSSVLVPDSKVAHEYGAEHFNVRQRINVPLTTLDASLPPNEPIDLLKVDVQGFELEVLQGGVEVLKRTRTVLLEANYVKHYRGGARFDEVFERMRELGFRVFGVSAPYGGSNFAPMWADAMFVREIDGADAE